MTTKPTVIEASNPKSPVQRVEYVDDDWGLVTIVDRKGRLRTYSIRRRDSSAINFPGLSKPA